VTDERVEVELRAWFADRTDGDVPESLQRYLADLPSVEPRVDSVRRTGTARPFDRSPRDVIRVLVAAAVVVALAAGLGHGLSQRPGPSAGNVPSSPPSQGSMPSSVAPSTAVAPSPSPSVLAGPYRWDLVSSTGELSTYAVVDAIRLHDDTYLAMAFGQEVRALLSQDGRSWTIEPADPGLLRASTDHLSLVAGLAEGNDVLVAVGSSALFDISIGDARAWTSSDGVRWQAAEPSKGFTDAAMEAVVAGPDGFVAVGSDGFPGANTQLPGAHGAAAWTSMDGRSWTRAPAQASFADAIMTGVRRTPAGFVAWGQTLPFAHPGPPPPPIWTSADGIRWVRGRGISDAGGPGSPISSAMSIGDRLVAVGTRRLPDALGAGYAPGAWMSTDGGRTWSSAIVDEGPGMPPRSGGMFDLEVDKPGLIAVGRTEPPTGQEEPGSAAVWRSSDGGVTWVAVPDDPSFARAAMSRIVATGTGFIVFGAVDDPNAAANVALIWVAEKAP
jgi:hypothetical protein